MVDPSKEIFLSFFDFWTGIKKQKIAILGCALFLGMIGFIYHLVQPIHYTAHSILKGRGSDSKKGILEASFDKLLSATPTYSPSADPKTFLCSYPVLKGVVERLNLQATICEKKKRNTFKSLWQTFQVERIRHRLKKQRLPSNILTKNSYVPDRVFFPDQKIPLQCTELTYSSPIARCFIISFVDEKHFQVLAKKGKKCIGEGKLDLPFKQPWGTFILRADEPFPRKRFILTLVPMEQAIKSLQQTVKVRKDRENESLVHLQYTHKNRQLAADVVNEAMTSYQTYLEEEGRRKITHQLKYLHHRFTETMEQLENVMVEQKGEIKGSLNAGEMATFEHELEFLFENQSQNYKELNKTALEMQELYQSIGKQEAHSFSDLLEKISQEMARPPDKIPSLTVKSGKALIADNQEKLDSIQLEQQQFDYYLTKLADPQFDCSSLSKILQDDTLLLVFEKILNLQRNLIDEKNWTQKEQKHLRETLELEKQGLVRHISQLKEGLYVQEDALHEQIHTLQEILLSLLLDRYRFIEQNIKEEVIEKADYFSQKWMAEGKISLNREMCLEVIDSLAKVIEASNISYHLDYMNATPLMPAQPPIVPDSPWLALSFAFGSLGGALLALFGICFREIWRGPSLSYPNLRSGGYTVCGLFSSSFKQRDLKTVRLIIHSLSQKGALVLITAQRSTTLPEMMSSLLSKRGEKILCIDLTSEKEPGLLNYLSQEKADLTLSNREAHDYLSCGEPKEFKEELLGTQRFNTLLTNLKGQYDRILFISNEPAHSIEIAQLQGLVDTSIYCVHEERFTILESLRPDTLFVLHPPKELPMLSLAQLRPLVEKIINRFSSSYFFASKRTPLKKP